MRESTNGNGWYNSEAEDDDQDLDQDQEGRGHDGLSRASSTRSSNKVTNMSILSCTPRPIAPNGISPGAFVYVFFFAQISYQSGCALSLV